MSCTSRQREKPHLGHPCELPNTKFTKLRLGQEDVSSQGNDGFHFEELPEWEFACEDLL